MIDQYDPEVAPDPREWLALDEGERHILAQEYHRNARVPLPKRARPIHAAIHATVETQLAMGIEVVQTTLQRLMQEGLSRHDAVHAIGSVLIGQIYDLLKGDEDDEDSAPGEPDTVYFAELQELTAEKWLNG
jgi:hypothetical protein